MIYRTIIFAALCLLLAGCSRTDHANPTLVAIESMMDEHPDSALMLLAQLDNKSLTNQADSALYNLLLVQAEDKNFIDRTSTERIDIAVNYYRQHSGNNDRRLMLALYYLGRIQENAQLYDLSIISMMEAEQLAQQQQDYFYLGLIYRSIANQYRSIYDFPEQLGYCKKACLAFELSHNLEYANYEKCNLAIALNYNQRYQEAIDTLNVVDNTAKSYGDTVTIIEAKRVMVYSYYMLSKYSDAINCYQDIISYGDSIKDIDRQEMAQLYDYAGDEAKTIKILSEVSSDYAGPKAAIYNTYAQKGDYRNAFLQLKNYLHLTDSTYQCITQQRVTQSVFEYNSNKIDKVKNQNRYIIRSTIFGICCFTIVIVVIVIILILRRNTFEKKNLNTIVTLENVASELKKQLNTLKSTQSNLSYSLMNMMQVRYNVLDELCQKYYEKPDDANPIKYAKILDSTIDKIRGNADFTNQLLDEFDIISNNLITDLKQNVHTLKASDFQLLAYLLAGFSNRSISILLCEKIEVVYNRKYHLKGKIAKFDYPRKNELLARL